mgnify:FL=1
MIKIRYYEITIENNLFGDTFKFVASSKEALHKYMQRHHKGIAYTYKEVSKWVTISV